MIKTILVLNIIYCSHCSSCLFCSFFSLVFFLIEKKKQPESFHSKNLQKYSEIAVSERSTVNHAVIIMSYLSYPNSSVKKNNVFIFDGSVVIHLCMLIVIIQLWCVVVKYFFLF